MYYLVLQRKRKTYRRMNSSFQHSYISKLLTLEKKVDTQYSKATQTRLQDHKTIIQIQNQ